MFTCGLKTDISSPNPDFGKIFSRHHCVLKMVKFQPKQFGGGDYDTELEFTEIEYVLWLKKTYLYQGV